MTTFTFSSNFHCFPQTSNKKTKNHFTFKWLQIRRELQKYREVPCVLHPAFPPKVTIVQDQNQKIDTGAIQHLFRFLILYALIFVCVVCIVLYSLKHMYICVTTITIKIQETIPDPSTQSCFLLSFVISPNPW